MYIYPTTVPLHRVVDFGLSTTVHFGLSQNKFPIIKKKLPIHQNLLNCHFHNTPTG